MGEALASRPVDAGPETSTASRAGRGTRFLGTAGAVFLGLVLLVAAWAKLLDPVAFAGEIRTQGLDFLLSAEWVARLALALEVGLGTALLLDLRRRWVLVPATLLVVFFVFLTGRTWYLDAQGLLPADASCGCFGKLVERTPAEAFWQDLLLLVPALGLAWIGRPRGARRFPPVRTAAVGVVTVGALAFAAAAPDLPLDDLATRLRPGVAVSEICAGGEGERVCLPAVLPEAAEGERWVVLADLGSEEFHADVDRLNQYVYRGDGAPLVVLAAATPDDVRSFFWQYGPAFDLREAPAPLLVPLYRRLPRSFRVVDGEVVETVDGYPPAVPDSTDAAAPAAFGADAAAPDAAAAPTSPGSASTDDAP